MTPPGEQLCYSDAYFRSVEGRVAAAESGDGTQLVLDRTVFYPGGGGQPSDRGLVLRSSEASAALVFPSDGSDDADMRSILTVMAIESVAPGVRTVAEVSNPRHEPHFRRADVDELLVTSKIASRLRSDHRATLLSVNRGVTPSDGCRRPLREPRTTPRTASTQMRSRRPRGCRERSRGGRRP